MRDSFEHIFYVSTCISFPTHMACLMSLFSLEFIWMMSRVARLDKLPWNDTEWDIKTPSYMLASSEMINMEIYLIWNHTGVAHNERTRWIFSEERIGPACKIIFMRKRLEAEKEIEIEKCLTYFTCATARVSRWFSLLTSRSFDRGTCAMPRVKLPCVGMCGMCLLLILHMKLKKVSSDHDFELPRGQYLREFQLLPMHADQMYLRSGLKYNTVRMCLSKHFPSLNWYQSSGNWNLKQLKNL